MENVQGTRSVHPLIIAASIAVILFCVAGVAAVMGWIPKSGADSELPAQEAKAPAQNAKAPAPAKVAAPRPSAAAAAKPHPLQVASAPATQAKAVCKDCGVIDSIHEREKAGEANGVGAVTGGVLGGVVGHQLGNGRGRDVMTVVGAVGGAVAGHQVEKNLKKSKVYDITVRFPDGSTRVHSQDTPPSLRVGDRVRLVDGELRPAA